MFNNYDEFMDRCAEYAERCHSDWLDGDDWREREDDYYGDDPTDE